MFHSRTPAWQIKSPSFMQLWQTSSSRNTFFFKITFITDFLFDSFSMRFINHVHIKIFEIGSVLRKLHIFLWKLSILGSSSISWIYTSVWPYNVRLTLNARWFWWWSTRYVSTFTYPILKTRAFIVKRAI